MIVSIRFDQIILKFESVDNFFNNDYSLLCFRYLLSISAGLEYCHSLGIIHLDVKPLNILVDPTTKTCKLCDFGASYNYFKNEIENLGHNLNHQVVILF